MALHTAVMKGIASCGDQRDGTLIKLNWADASSSIIKRLKKATVQTPSSCQADRDAPFSHCERGIVLKMRFGLQLWREEQHTALTVTEIFAMLEETESERRFCYCCESH